MAATNSQQGPGGGGTENRPGSGKTPGKTRLTLFKNKKKQTFLFLFFRLIYMNLAKEDIM